MSENFAQLFTKKGQLPDHEDYEYLRTIINQLDEISESEEDPLDKRVGEIGDLDSIYYVAFQRVMAALELKTVEDLKENQEEVVFAAACWLEGMIAGYNLHWYHNFAGKEKS